MKKKLFVGLVTVIMMFSLMVTPAFAAATSFDAVAEFDSTSATAENGPWGYNITTDAGATFTPCTVLEAGNGLTPWHPVAGQWTGVGLNDSVPDFVELNADGNGTDGALSFTVPEDGNYTFSVNAKNVWEQPADVLHASLNGTDLFTVELSVGAEADPTAFEQTGVALKAGEVVYFFCPSTTAGGWVSAYIQLVVTKEEAAAVEETTETTTDVPKTGVVGLGLIFGAGAVITGAFSLKRKSK